MPDTANETREESPGEVTSKPAPRRQARAELVWEGKYDSAGNRVAPVRVPLPFQTVETVNESVQERQRGFLFESPAAWGGGTSAHAKEWRNRLIWGDKKYVLPSLLAEFAGKVNLIYIDPPFDTGADFSFTATVPDHPDTPEELGGGTSASFTFTKEPSIIEHKAYRDTWGRGLDSYLQWFYESVVLLHELLHENGSLYVHLDWHVGHYAKLVLDEIFGGERMINEIVWKRSDAKGDSTQGSKHFGRVHDVILFYTKSEGATWNPLFVPLDEDYVKTFYKYKDPDGRRWKMENMLGPGGAARGNPIYEVMGVTRSWRYSRERMQQLIKAGRVVQTKPGNVPMEKRYLHESKGTQVGSWWDDISMIRGWSAEKTGYATQKPEALLGRILNASSNETDLVLDSFCGSGTTASVAEKLKRRWIACDLGRFAIHTTRKRLLSIPGVRPFTVQNLGKYERQMWAGAAFGDGNGKQAAARQRAYIEFTIALYQATPLNGYTWLHGVKSGRMVHVGAVDAPVSTGDVTQIAAEFKRAIGTGKDAPKTNGVDVLGWDFAFELNEVAKQQAAAANIQLRFLRIPHDAMDKRAVAQGDIHFFELAALAVDVKVDRRDVTLKLKDFLIPPDDVPEDARRTVKHWSQWIDYWAVDWNNKGDTFHNEWQTYRTRKDNTLALETTHAYTDAGEYTVVVKVIDILGNDTAKTVKIVVK